MGPYKNSKEKVRKTNQKSQIGEGVCLGTGSDPTLFVPVEEVLCLGIPESTTSNEINPD